MSDSELLRLFGVLFKATTADDAEALIVRKQTRTLIREAMMDPSAVAEYIVTPTYSDSGETTKTEPLTVLRCLKLGLGATMPEALRMDTLSQLHAIMQVQCEQCSIPSLFLHSELLNIIINDVLLGESIALAEKAITFLVDMSCLPSNQPGDKDNADRYLSGLDVFMHDNVAGTLRTTMSSDDAKNMRIFECVLKIGVVNGSSAILASPPTENTAAFIVHSFVDMICGDEPDVLLRMSALELVKWVATNGGLEFLYRSNMMAFFQSSLQKSAHASEEDILERMFVDALIKCLTHMAESDLTFTVWEMPSPVNFLHSLLECLSVATVSARVESCFLVIGSFAALALKCIEELLNDAQFSTFLCTSLASNDVSASTAAFHCIRKLISPASRCNKDTNEAFVLIQQKLLTTLQISGRSLLEFLRHEIEKHPVVGDARDQIGGIATNVEHTIMERRRIAPYAILGPLCCHAQGAEMMLRTKGLLELLLNRAHDGTRVGREVKYEILRSLVDEEITSSVRFTGENVVQLVKRITPPAMYEQIVQHVKDGPIASGATSTVLVADQTL